MHRRGVLISVLAIAAVVGVVAVTVIRKTRRDAEWADGGDHVALTAALQLVSPSTYAGAVAALGGPADQKSGDAADVIVRVRWTGPDSRAHEGYYEFVVLSQTGGPTLLPNDAWGAGVGGFGWDGRYQALSQHYPWLSGTTDVPDGQGGVSNSSSSTSVPAAATGALTIALPADDLVSSPDGLRRLVVGVFYVRDGDVRWAKRIPVTVAA